MPGMNSIEGGRWDNLLRRFFNIKERGVAPSMAPEIVPIVNVEPPDDPTMPFLRDVRTMGAYEELAAVAAEFGQLELRNPTGSNAIITTQEIMLWGTAITGYEVRVQIETAEINQVTKALRDLRWDDGTGGLIQRSTGLFLSFTSPARYGIQVWGSRALGDTQVFMRDPIVLPPGYSVFAGVDAVNQIFGGGFVWSERPLEPSEL